MSDNVVVTIRCLVYNHEPYIRQCLEGFVMQKTNFPFEAIVHDDASTDGSAAIIREYAEKYPDIIKPILETENQYSKQDGSLRRIMDSHTRGKYIAYCEGDDYWIDPLKLQKQVDFMEEHLEYGLCYTRVKYYHQDTRRFVKTWGGTYVTFNDLFKRNTVPTLTVLLRTNLYNQYLTEIKLERQHWKMGDYPMWLWFSYRSNVKFSPDVTGVYRVLGNSASHSTEIEKNLSFVQSGLDIKRFYNQFFNLGITEQTFEYKQWCLALRTYALYMKYRDFISTFKNGILNHPSFLFRINSYKYLLFFISKNLREKYK